MTERNVTPVDEATEEEVEVVPAEEVPGDPEAPVGEAEAPYYPDPRGEGEPTPEPEAAEEAEAEATA